MMMLDGLGITKETYPVLMPTALMYLLQHYQYCSSYITQWSAGPSVLVYHVISVPVTCRIHLSYNIYPSKYVPKPEW